MPGVAHAVGASINAVCAQIVGEKEKAEKTVNVRTRDNVVHGEHKLSEVLAVLQREKTQRSLAGHFGHPGPAADSNGAAAAEAAAAANTANGAGPAAAAEVPAADTVGAVGC